MALCTSVLLNDRKTSSWGYIALGIACSGGSSKAEHGEGNYHFQSDGG